MRGRGGTHPTGMRSCYHPQMKLWEGNVFTGVCLSTEVCLLRAGVCLLRGSASILGVCLSMYLGRPPHLAIGQTDACENITFARFVPINFFQ